jgi:hypothetical protein
MPGELSTDLSPNLVDVNCESGGQGLTLRLTFNRRYCDLVRSTGIYQIIGLDAGRVPTIGEVLTYAPGKAER